MDVERSMTDMGIDGHYYLAWMDRPERHLSHDECTTHECIARNVNRDTYQQKHACRSGDCGGGVKADISAVVRIIETPDHGPVFRWNPRKRELEVASSHMIRRGSSNPPFVAISHV